MSKRQRRSREKQSRHSGARSLAASGGLALAATLLSGSVAEAATFTVTDGTDSAAANGANCTADATTDPHCRLRDAITQAKLPANAGSTITFASSLSGSTIALAAPLPQMTQATTIVGPGSGNLTIDGGGKERIFDVASSGAVNISGLTATNGYVKGQNGGAIRAAGTGGLTLSDVTASNSDTVRTGNFFKYGGGGGGGVAANAGTPLVVHSAKVSGNQAKYGGGIAAQGAFTLTDSTISANHGNTGGTTFESGGGLALSGAAATRSITNSAITGNATTGVGGGVIDSAGVSIANSTISGNSATQGGGVYSQSGQSITDSTISGNSATMDGGGVHSLKGSIANSTISANTSGAAGGGVFERSTGTIANSTISGNTGVSSGGGVYEVVNGSLANSTISGNSANKGGGVFADNSSGQNPSLESSIVAGNTLTGTTPSAPDVSGSAAESFSLVQDPTGLTVTPAATTNLNGSDPLLGTLADNGGPTKTIEPAPTSPVIDQGKDFTTTGLDQRGLGIFDAPSIVNAAGGDGRDIGALERQAAVAITIATPTSGATYTTGQVVQSSFTCTGLPPKGACVDQNGKPSGTPIDTSTLGPHTFTVKATNIDGVVTTTTANYTVVAPTPSPPTTTTPTTPTTTSPAPPGPTAPAGLSDAAAYASLTAPFGSAAFATGGVLGFSDLLPEAGQANYYLELSFVRGGVHHRVGLGRTFVAVTMPGAVTPRIVLKARARRILNRHPGARLVIRTYFIVAATGHHIDTTRLIRPAHRPGG